MRTRIDARKHKPSGPESFVLKLLWRNHKSEADSVTDALVKSAR